MLQEEIYIRSSMDGTMQPSLFFRAETREKRPLLVALHTWSHNRTNQIQYLLKFAEEQDFNLLLPEFRGPNLKSNPYAKQACGSVYAKQDIKDAIDHIKATECVDENNIFLVGLSGGGHMAMLMAGFCPAYFKAIAAFVPISDLRTWREESPHYTEHIDHCCSESPKEMFDRSPIKYINEIAKANLKIFHGKFDSVVPVSQSIRFYNEMMIRHPNATVYLDVFDGGHQFSLPLCQNWLLSQYKKKESQKVTN